VVSAGPYRFTRNPIYIGMVLGIVGVGLAAGSAWTMLMALPFVVVIDRGVIAREERYLSAKFGATYDTYRARVRRWI
jgi:protein-S-isoprenylcysteine O-methyltransferase Ste14